MQKNYQGLTPQPPYPWFGPIWQGFIEQAQNDHLPHAILLCSPGGVGELDLGYALAQYLLCGSPQGQISCGTCKSCQLVASDSHPDLVGVFPEEKSSVIKVEAIRTVGAFVANTAQQGGRKLIVLYPAETMNANAANALLKNLEEPNGNTTFILVTQNPTLLMATIRSRCTQWALPIPNKAEAIQWLERNKVSDAALKLEKANGLPLKVVQWEADDVYARSKSLAAATGQYLRGEAELVKVSKALSGMDALWLLDQWMEWLHKSIRNGVTAVADTAGAESPFWGETKRLFCIYDQLLVRKQQLLRGSNPNAQLLIEELLIDLKVE